VAAPDDRTRHWLLEALTAAKSPAAFELWLRYFLRHEEPGYRAHAAEGLRRLGDARAAPPLLELARDADPVPRAAAVEALGAVRAPAMLAAVVDALDDPAGEVAGRARYALRKFGAPGCAALLERIRGRGATPARCEALTWYLLIERSEGHLLEIMSDELPEVRHAALACLNGWGQRFASDALRDAIGRAAADPVALVRHRAVVALRWFATTECSRAALLRALEDPTPAIRAAAVDSAALAFERP
jgi:HEAT repeat protein